MHAHPQPAASPADPTRFVYGGVAFDFAMAPGLPFELMVRHREYLAPFDLMPAALSVRVAAASAPELAAPDERTIHAEWNGATARVRTRGVRAEVRQLGPRSFAATGLVSPDSNGCTSLCGALVGALIDRVGGVVLHASAVELDGGVVLFVGPSGAGKTTAASLCLGAYAYARDRAAVFPTPSGWHVAPMHGGSDAVQLPPSVHRVRPLLGVLRVMQGGPARAESSAPVRAVGILRESAQMTNRSPAAESALLDRLVAMSAEIPVGTVHTALGEPLTDRLRAWARRGS